jgi:hypothetical protein
MKMKALLLLLISSTLLMSSCSKDTKPQLNFTGNVAEGTANSQGEYTITGHISSTVRLENVYLTRQGETTPFYVDESTAKNKNEYDFTWPVSGITANTTIMIRVTNQEGGAITGSFLIKK